MESENFSSGDILEDHVFILIGNPDSRLEPSVRI
jgi:hypothetical protein